MTKRPQVVTQKKLVCTQCGNPTYIFRASRRPQSGGHIKHMWCYICKDRTAFEQQKQVTK